MTDACKTPMADHVAEFWRLLETEHVRILIDIRVEHDDSAVVHWDSSSFSNTVAKAIAADHRATQPEYLSGCLHPGKEPNSCQYEGKCLSLSGNLLLVRRGARHPCRIIVRSLEKAEREDGETKA